MNKRQESGMSMVRKMVGEVMRYNEIIKSDTVIIDELKKINNIVSEIITVNYKQGLTTEGLTEQKKEYRNELNEATVILFGIIRSYAVSINDDNLYQNSNFTLTGIKRLKDTEINSKSDYLLDYSTKNIEPLKIYGLEEKMVGDYKVKSDNYQESCSAPQRLMVERKTATEQLKELFKTLEERLTMRMDTYMIKYKDTHPEFYSNYKNARVIYDEPTISKSLMGQVTDETTDRPLKYVEVNIEFNDNGELKTFTKTTSVKGNYQFKGLPSGKCKITFVKNYYEELSMDSEVYPNELSRVNVQIKKEQQN